jgi:outer membrane protein
MPRHFFALSATSAIVMLLAQQAPAADLEAVQAAPEATVAEQPVGPWKVRLRGLYVLTHNQGFVTGIKGSDLSYSNTTVPELDISYYFNDNLAAELILGTTFANVHGEGSIAALGKVGKVWLLPPTATLQYHFTNFGNFKPYIGAGVNYTLFYNQSAKSADSLDVKNSFGGALQAGFDYQLSDRWDFNVDVKKIYMEPKFDVTVGGTDFSGKAKINPWLVGTGIGYRF